MSPQATLQGMFKDLDLEIITAVLESNKMHMESTVEQLLSMQHPNVRRVFLLSFMIFAQKYKEGDIIAAATKGDVTQLEQCLGFGANIEEQDRYGRTALLAAVYYGHKAAAEFLIGRKANLNHTNKVGAFPLYLAAFYGHKDISEVLLKAGADKSRQCDGKTAAQWAAEQGHKTLAEFIESWGKVRLRSMLVSDCHCVFGAASRILAHELCFLRTIAIARRFARVHYQLIGSHACLARLPAVHRRQPLAAAIRKGRRR